MRAKFHVGGLLAALDQVSKAVPKQSPKAILQQVKLVCTDTDARLIVNDLDIAITYFIAGVAVEEHGEVLLPPDRVSTILKNTAKDTQIEIVSAQRGVDIIKPSGRSNLTTEDASLFPTPPSLEFGGKSGLSVEFEPLATGLARTILCTDPNSTRYALGGVSFEVQPETKELHLIATDGRRLCQYTLAASVSPEFSVENNPVLPTKSLKILSQIKGEDFCDIAIDRHQVAFRTSRCTIVARIVEGRFPRWQDVIPETTKTTVSVVPDDLQSAIDSASATLSEESRGVDLAFNEEGCMASSKSADAGSSLFGFTAAVTGNPVAIRIDPKFLSPHLQLVKSPPMDLRLNDGKSAMVVESPNCKLVLMPLTPEAN